MTVIMVLLTFAAFILLDWLLAEKPAAATVPVAAMVHEPAAPVGELVEGFHTPSHVRYHPGHTWVLRERKNFARVGMDEFAAALSGAIERIELPHPGQWVRQGQRIIGVTRNGERVEMVSPAEGEVIEVNEEVMRNPSAIRQEPYGKGWLFAVHVPDEESTSRNLIPDSLVPSWMGDAIHRLFALQPATAGAIMADGGRPTDDLLAHVPEVPWQPTAAGFFLTGKPDAGPVARELQM